MRKKVLLLIVVMLGVIIAGGCFSSSKKAGQKTITLKYAFFAPASTFPAKQMEKWASLVEERTEGKVKVETFPGGTLLKAKDMYDGVLQRVADIGLSCPTYEPGRFPLLAIADLPGLFPNSKVASLTLWELTQEFQPKSLEDFKVISMFATEPAYIQSTKPIKKLKDLEGMELRISGANVPVLKQLGATPVGMPMGEVAQALQTGVIDGYATSREVLKDFKFAEEVKYVTNYPLSQTSFAAVMNKDKWKQLSPETKKVINDLGREMALWTGKYLDKHVQESLKWARKKEGVKVIDLSTEEKKRWDKKLETIKEEVLKKAKKQGLPGRKFLKGLYELRDKYSKKYQ